MRIHRRQFFARLAIAPIALGSIGWPTATRTESMVLNWPHAILKTPIQREGDKAPVITAIEIHPHGNLIATAGDDHVVYLWDAGTGKVLRRLQDHTDWVHTLAFSPTGDVLASAGTDRRVIFWDVRTAEKLYVLESQNHPITKIAWNHGGEFIAGTGFEDKLRIYDAHTRTLTRELQCPCNDMRVVAFSPDDSLLAAGGRDGVVRVWKVAEGQHAFDYRPHRHRIRGLEFSPDGNFIVTAGEDRQVHVHPIENAGNAAVTGYNLPPCGAKVMSLEFYGPQELATGCSDNLIRLWNVANRNELGTLRGHTGSVTALAHFGRTVVSGSYDTTIRIWTVTENVADDGASKVPAVRTSRKPE